MGKTFTKCNESVLSLVSSVMKDCHKDLATAEVTIHCLFAEAQDKDGMPIPALKKHGQVVAAQISVTSLADRTRGLPDAKLVIDRNEWDKLNEQLRLALIDHELEHLSIATKTDKKTGAVSQVFDDLGRPKLKLRNHSWEITGFASVAERRGKASIEALIFSQFTEQYGELGLLDQTESKDVTQTAAQA